MARASSAERGSGKRTTVLFDSSFLIAVMENPTSWSDDILEEVGAYTPLVLSSVRDELARLAASGDKRGRFAALALSLLEEGVLYLEPDGGGKPDDEIVSFALGKKAAVATVDSELARRLRASRVPRVITLRGGRVAL